MASLSDRTRRELTSIRDTVESIWVAIVVALVLRAFVIPTGSMAPELMGEHWDLVCPFCGYEYAYGGPKMTGDQAATFRWSETYLPQGAHCPNCGRGYEESEERDGKEFLSGGDRVLVLKYLYRFSPPKPFDVVVFRNPQNNRENYIKRLIGLPGETIEIVHGDVFVSSTPEGPRHIRRKPRAAQAGMWQLVFDNDYQPDTESTHGVGSPRWVPSKADLWQSDAYGRRMVYAGGPAPGELVFEAERAAFGPHYAYNALEGESVVDPAVDVCTDLKLSVEFLPAEAHAAVALTLSSFDDCFRGEVTADGSARLLYRKLDAAPDQWTTWATASIRPLQAGRGCQVALENVDESVRLVVDGTVVLEVTDGYPKDYQAMEALVANAHEVPVPVPQVHLTAWGGRSELRHLRLMRDVYYTGLTPARPPSGPLGDYARQLGLRPADLVDGWGTTGHPITLAKHEDNPDLDEFFVLGDNSPQSLDSRGWTWAAPTLRLYDRDGKPLYQLGTVPRYNLIGKAFFVYWPSGFRPPGLPGLPIVPNFGKIRFVR
jgi:signal peptidase I